MLYVQRGFAAEDSALCGRDRLVDAFQFHQNPSTGSGVPIVPIQFLEPVQRIEGALIVVEIQSRFRKEIEQASVGAEWKRFADSRAGGIGLVTFVAILFREQLFCREYVSISELKVADFREVIRSKEQVWSVVFGAICSALSSLDPASIDCFSTKSCCASSSSFSSSKPSVLGAML